MATSTLKRVASWSPDGTKIVYAARHAGNFDIYTIDADGQNRVQLTTDPRRDDYPEWTSDGRILVHSQPLCRPDDGMGRETRTARASGSCRSTGERQLCGSRSGR